MGCGGCRAQREFVPTKSQPVKTPCHKILEAQDGLMVEVTVSGSLIPSGQYGHSLTRTLTVLGCQGHGVATLKEIELTVMEICQNPVKSARFYQVLGSRLTTLSQVKKAIRST